MSTSKTIVKGTLTVLSFLVAGSVIGYLFRLLLARTLSIEDFGLYYAIFAFVSVIYGLKGVGFGTAIVRYVTECKLNNDQQGIKNLLTTFFLIQFGLSAIFTLVVLFFAPQIASEHFHTTKAIIPLIILTIAFLVTTFTTTFKGLFNAYQHMGYHSLVDFLQSFLTLILTIPLFFLTKTVLAPATATLVAYAFTMVWSFWIANKLFPIIKTPTKVTKDSAKKLFGFVLPTALGSLGVSILKSLDTVTLTQFSTLSNVALYNVALPTAQLLRIIPRALTQTLLPVISEQHIKKSGQLPQLLKNTYAISFAVITPLVLLFLIFPELIITTIFGPTFVGAALSLRFLSIAMLFASFALINQYLLLGLDKPKAYAITTITGTVITIILNIVLVKRYGLTGISIATLLSNLLLCVLTFWSVSRIINFQLPWSSWMKTLLASALFIITVTFMKSILHTNRYAEAIIASGIAGIVYLAMIHTLKVLTIEEVKKLLQRTPTP